jgi:phosphoribosylformylglycinamidine synthase subunit PurL
LTIAVAPSAAPDAVAAAPGLHRALGLTDEELDAIRDRLGRDPNELELAMFSVMWSEHCSYKSSRPLLEQLPTTGTGVLAGPGENAGAISIGDGLAVVFKLESHNHPSAVEPYQGAATGVGGILRDIFTMGARPVAVLDALKFGDPAEPRTRRLVDGVVRGVGGYGNCIGIPTVGGELVFHPSYADNPLVNVMAVGIAEERHLTRASAPGPGNLAVLFGSTTGRDGIGGASVLASANFGQDEPSKRPTVQVGDPFMGKLILEVSLDLIARGLVEGLQDLGAAGITCAVSETADRAGTGIRVELDRIPRREEGMAPFEVMISESQERMLAVVRPDRLAEVEAVCERWAVPVAVIGRVTDDTDITVVQGDEVLARIPAAALTSDAIVYQRRSSPPARRRPAPAPGIADDAVSGLPKRGTDPGAVLLSLLASPDLGSRAWVTTQYDSTVGADTVAGSELGAGIIRVKGTSKALVMATDAQARIGAIDPWLGAAMALAECARNVAITGARPLGVTDCLNFGDPTQPEAFWQLERSLQGLADASRALGLPVTGGNVSLYNESPKGRIDPTAQVGVVGLLAELDQLVRPAFGQAGDLVGLLGEVTPGMAGSHYAELAGPDPDDRPPSLDLDREVALQQTLLLAASGGLLRSAQDVSGGGLAVSLAECCIWGGIGATLDLGVRSAAAVELFGESPSRVVVSAAAGAWPRLQALASEHALPLRRLGLVGGKRLQVRLTGIGATGAAEERGTTIERAIDLPIADLQRAWERALPSVLGEV